MGGLHKQADDDYEHEPTYTPTKLSQLISRPTLPPEKPTLPPQTTVSIPFQWEEAPGKPRQCHTQSEPNITARALELPPRLLSFSNSNVYMPSPTTVLNGPYVGRAMSFASSYRTPRGYGNPSFGSTRWDGFRKNGREDDEGSFDFSRWPASSSHGTNKSKVKVTRVPVRRSFLSLSHSHSQYQTRSHFWASIYESFKQVVPWRRKREGLSKWASKFDTV